MGLFWVATEAKTGLIIGDLPDLDVATVKSVIGRFDTTSGTLPIPSAPENWDRATLPGAAHLILLMDNPADPTHGIPLWGARITGRERTEGDTITLTLATIESYLDARYMGDYAPVSVGQNTLISVIVNTWVTTGTNGGLPLRIVTSGADTPNSRTWANLDNKPVYSVLQDLMGSTGGPEWTFGWEWQSNPERITPVFYVGARLGVAVPVGQLPNATFEMPGPVKSFKYKENYASGKGANVVIASSSGTTTARPQSTPQTFVDALRPTIEHRFTPSTGVSDVPALTTYAASALAAMKTGTNGVELSAIMAEAPQLGVDWSVGDDIGYQIGVTGFVPSVPRGLIGVARAIGFQIDISTTPVITPILSGTGL